MARECARDRLAQAVIGRRGEIVLVALPGDYGKARPALVVQADIEPPLASVLLCPLTSTIAPGASALRVVISPSTENGLRQPSSVMVDKLTAVRRTRLKASAGMISADEMTAVIQNIALLLGLA